MTDDRLRPDPSLPPIGRTMRAAGAFALGVLLVLGSAPPAAATQPSARSSPAAPVPRSTPASADVPDASSGSRTPPPLDDATSSPGDGPSIIAIDAAAHAGDRIRFTPGAAVSVAFTPRSGDRLTVGGVAPRRLPAGAATGRAMAASRQGVVWAPGSTAPQASAVLAGPGRPRSVDTTSGPSAPSADPTAFTLPVPSTSATPASARDLRRQVFGFLPYWELTDPSTRLRYDLLSTIAYFGVGVTPTGDLVKRDTDGRTSVGWAGWTSSRMTTVIDDAHRHGTRVVLTVQSFAWTTGQARNQSALLGNAAARLKLARQIAAAVRDRGADGVNLDFEPLTSGRGDEFVSFVRSLRSELDKLARGYQLTFDTTGSIGNYPIEAATASGAADAVFVMGYDYRTAGSSVAGSVAPLTGPVYDLTDTVRAFTDRIAPSKVILGIPYYGRAWSTVSDAPNARTQTGTKYGQSASITYGTAADLAAANGRRYDSVEETAWTAYRRQNCTATYGCVTSWREVYYDDAQSLGAKYDLIDRYGLRGAGIWALGYDGTRPELYDVIVAKFVHDSTPPEAGLTILAPSQGDEGFAVAWSALDASPVRDYDVQVSVDRGPWTSWRTRTTDTAAIYPGRDGHRYALRVRATDANGNIGAWDVTDLPVPTPSLKRGGFATVRVATMTVRARAHTSAAAIGRLAKGDIVAVTAGPSTADGYIWYRVSGPLSTWAPVRPVRFSGWVAARRASTSYLAARAAPNTTLVAAGLAGLSFGTDGAASVGVTATAIAARTFSPNRDGAEDGLALHWRNSVALGSLTLRVLRASDGAELGSRSIPRLAKGAQAFTWDGSVGGRTLPDGRYLLQLVGRVGGRTFRAPSADPADPGQASAFAVVVDTGAPTITAATSSTAILSPNGDGRLETVTVNATTAGGATHWRLSATPSAGTGAAAPMRTVTGTGPAPRAAWDGRSDGGAVVPDGRYRLTLAVVDDAGNDATRSWEVVVDTSPPPVAVGVATGAISPDGDGTDDAGLITWTTGETATATLQVLRGSTVVRTLAVPRSATTGTARWDGRDARGRVVADGPYVVRLLATDAAANRASATAALRVDRTAGWLRWSPDAFDPVDGDRLAGTARVAFRLTRRATTTLRIEDAAGVAVRTAWSARLLRPGSTSWTWDGFGAAHRTLPAGTYRAVLVARSALGTVTVRRTVLLDAFVPTLSATTLTAGQTLTVTFRTVEPLRGRPSVTFSQAGRPAVTRTAGLVGPGRYRVTFRVAAGTGPATLRISGRDTAGGSNVTSRTVTVR